MTDRQATTNVLLAEDDLDDVLIFRLALNKLPFTVELRHAADGEKLFIMLKELIPDVLFLDINMPSKNGVACIVEIRKNPEYNQMPVIFYTSYRNLNYIDQCYANGANFYLIKANSVRELADRLRKIFSVDWKTYMFYPPKDEFVIGD